MTKLVAESQEDGYLSASLPATGDPSKGKVIVKRSRPPPEEPHPKVRSANKGNALSKLASRVTPTKAP